MFLKSQSNYQDRLNQLKHDLHEAQIEIVDVQGRQEAWATQQLHNMAEMKTNIQAECKVAECFRYVAL